MNKIEYFKKINEKIQSCLDSSLCKNDKNINCGLFLSQALQTWNTNIPDGRHKVLMNNCIQSLELSLVCQMYCMYRSAFTSLRLSMEMLFGSIYYSTSLLEFIEWEKSLRDLNWKTINDPDNGILSPRFANAFFKEIDDVRIEYLEKANNLYRELSEFVHGNNHTWNFRDNSVNIDDKEIERFGKSIGEYLEIASFVLSLRYLKTLEKSNLEQVEPMLDSLSHVKSISTYFAGKAAYV